MACLLVALALLTPRVAVALLWFFSNWFVGLFPLVLWPLLGFVFLPTTLLWYSAVQHWFGVRGIGSLYYLMYAIRHGLPESLALDLIHFTLIVVTLSILVHGLSIKPLMFRFRLKAR